jgi:hypothetical protein
VNDVFFLLGDSPLSGFYVPTLDLNRSFNKNNWDKIARVFRQVKVWPIRRRRNGELWRATATDWSTEEEPWNSSDLTIIFQEAVSFL